MPVISRASVLCVLCARSLVFEAMLHIVNGDATRTGLERSNVPGTFASWGDVLHAGPTPAGVTPDEWRRIRAAYLVSRDMNGVEEHAGRVAGQYEREDAALESWPGHDEVVFWFEHDLYAGMANT